MVAAATDKFQKVGIATATTLDAPGYTIAGTSVTVASTSNMPTDTGITFAMDEIDANGEQVANSYNEYVGTVASGTSITNVSHENGTDRNFSAGTTSRVYMPVSAERENRLVEGLLNHADQDGTLKAGAVDVAGVLASDVVTTAKILDANVTAPKVASGFTVQTVSTNFSAVATGTTTIPFDDTIPQNTEGDQYMTLAYTPKSATNELHIEALALVSNSAVGSYSIALFQDATANALAASSHYQSTVTAPTELKIDYKMTAGTTSSTTFKIRVGSDGVGTTTFNGAAAGRKFGGIANSSLKITETKA